MLPWRMTLQLQQKLTRRSIELFERLDDRFERMRLFFFWIARLLSAVDSRHVGGTWQAETTGAEESRVRDRVFEEAITIRPDDALAYV
jgi:hypothetical protein